jgi:hypothetical protein
MSYSIKINFEAFKFIPYEYKEQCYKSMLNDIYYFYYSKKPNKNEKIICIDGNKFNLSRDNILLMDNDNDNDNDKDNDNDNDNDN